MTGRHVGRGFVFFVLVLALCMGAPAEMAGEAEFGIELGAIKPDDEISGDDSGVKPMIGLTGGLRFTKHWGWMLDVWLSDFEAVVMSDPADPIQGRQTLAVRGVFEVMLGREERKHRAFFNLGGGAVDFDAVNSAFITVGVGQRLTVGDQRYLRWQFRADQTLDEINGRKVINPQFLVTFTWGIGGKMLDDDGDGVADKRDDCPDTPQGARVDSKGCPIDTDGDGVPNGIDQCPDTPAGWAVDAVGCPTDSDQDGVPDGEDACPGTAVGAKVDAKGCPIDSDGDGVPDGLDRCPGTPAEASVDANGCPLDSDGDGVPDYMDDCPDTPQGYIVDSRGCPKDSDGDGVPDSLDDCPNTPKGVPVWNNGCPKPLFPDGADWAILKGVNFGFNSVKVTPNARRILDGVAASMKLAPDNRFEIGGHTDSVGVEDYNVDLSRRRAEAVREYLVSKGIEPGRLEVRGYGASDPVASNDTEEGRSLNRRVQLRILE